jgi:membrane dipeptidase
MRFHRPAVFFAAVFVSLAASIAPPQVKPDGTKAYEHIRFLAAESLRGRKSGTPEYMKAAEYVAAKMKEIGLLPAGDKGTYFQEVPLKSFSNFEPPIRMEITDPRNRAFVPGRGRDFYPAFGTGSGTVRGLAAFVGYGVVSESPAWDDYAGLDVKGRILILLPDAPESFGDAVKDWPLERKVKLAVEKGAAGIIEMDLSQPGQPPVRRRASGMLQPGSAPAGFVIVHARRDCLDDLFYAAQSSWRDAVSKILRFKKPLSFPLDATLEMEAHFVREERKAVNVLGVIPGADRKLKDEVLILGGHLDHLGVGYDGFVFPGADDNATSAAVVLETAWVLKAGGYRPARTLLFASWAGEEMGLVGSRWYAEHPVFPLAKTACYLNIDMVGTGDATLMVGGMFEYAKFFDLIKSKLDPDLVRRLRPRVNYRGSDHSTFWDKGVTAISLRTGEVLTGKLDDKHPEYHRPGDRAETIDPGLLRAAAEYHLEVIKTLASTKENLFLPQYRAEFIHKDAPVVDLHCDTISRFMAGEDLRQDLPQGHIDIPKLKRGAVDLQVFACFSPPPADEAAKAKAAKGVFDQIEAVYRLAGENPGDLEIVKAPADFSRLQNSGKTGILIGIEGGYAIENDLDLLRSFHRVGVRLMTLTHWTHTDWADASGDPRPVWNGLTEFGRSVVKEMNRLGMIIDVSHVADKTFWDVIGATEAPIVASHSCCRALAGHFRNLTDDMIKALAKNGGVVGINFAPGFINVEADQKTQVLWDEVAEKSGLPADYREAVGSDPEKKNPGWAEFAARRAALDKTSPLVDVGAVVDHIDYVVKIIGNANHVGLGSDFDGIEMTPAGLENAGKLPAITDELVRRGYKEPDIRKILGGNFVRVWNAVQRAASAGAGPAS